MCALDGVVGKRSCPSVQELYENFAKSDYLASKRMSPEAPVQHQVSYDYLESLDFRTSKNSLFTNVKGLL